MASPTRVLVAAWAFALALVAVHTRVWAHSNGIESSGCNGCHAGGAQPAVHLTASPDPTPGATVTLHVTIAAVNGPVGGIYLRTNGTGQLHTIAGQDTRLINATEATHSAPRTASGGNVTFDLQWVAPSTPGSAMIDVWALSGNNNRQSSGDGGGEAHLPLVYGCTGTTFYRDYDDDGYGSTDSGTTIACSMPEGYATRAGDCDENDAAVHPGATEVCDARDNNCNGQVDEGVSAVTLYQDDDGDGYGRRNGRSVTACPPPHGYGVGMDDCDDTHATVHPGAVEVCDLLDNNCNGRVDEGVRPRCGVGWCNAEAYSCDPDDCSPGRPQPEVCDYLDNDCNGVVDDGTNLCAAGQVCTEGSCSGDGGVRDAATGGSDAHTNANDAGNSTLDAHTGTTMPPAACAIDRAPRGRASGAWGLALGAVGWALGRRRRRG